MLIPIRCFTCGKVLADKWDWYNEEVKKMEELEEQNKAPPKKENPEEVKYFDKVKSKELLDKLGLTRYCCRRHMLGQVDMMNVI
jgi:DNA-directed RNA polymerase subunit N (RpoN/RPB10)